MRGSCLVAAVVALSAVSVHGQGAPARQRDSIPVRTMADDPFFPLDRRDLPAPSRVRGPDGSPGPDYWQQRADYIIHATLDTAAHTLTAKVTIHYTNNSPDTLHFVWLQVEQELYRPDSKGARLNPSNTRFAGRGIVEGGYRFKSILVGGTSTEPKINDTMMRLDLPSGLAPHGGTLTIEIEYSYNIPAYGSDRFAHDSLLYQIAQWYPRMVVYDDVRGWNPDPYLGQGEFYLEYGDIDYDVTVPAGYTVGGTGLLTNADKVLGAERRQRLRQAAGSTATVAIITDAEATSARGQQVPGTKTWRFHAHNVRDVAWAAAPDFRWDARTTGPIPGNAKGVLCQAYYESPRAGKAWESGADITAWTIKYYSEHYFPFPYPQATSVAGHVLGMEYPMFVMVGFGGASPSTIFSVIDHEHGHEWFPMIVGSNERRYAWMDEGFNTYINGFSGKDWRVTQPDLVQRPSPPGPRMLNPAASGQPVMTAADHTFEIGTIGYGKPAAVLHILREAVLGPDVFDHAFQVYIRRWAFKHPTPGDFFRTIESVSGEDLAWFWRGYFYSNETLDIGIDTVRMDSTVQIVRAAPPDTGFRRKTTGARWTLILSRHTGIVFPVDLAVKFADGTTQEYKLPVDIWGPRRDPRHYQLTFDKQVVGARLWPHGGSPDSDPQNDTWGDAPPMTEGTPVSAR